MLRRVLWIEDGALSEFQNLITPIYVTGRFDLELALNATEAVQKLVASEFEVIIVDIRLPPGDDESWIKLYKSQDSNPAAARLGLQLLRALLKPDSDHAGIRLGSVPSWIQPNRFGVFTVENEIQEDLEDLGVKVYERKDTGFSRKGVIALIERVLDLQLEPKRSANSGR